MKLIQIRNVPDEVHATLKSRAAKARMSLSDYLLQELAWIADAPAPEELEALLRDGTGWAPHVSNDDIVAIIRADRESH